MDSGHSGHDGKEVEIGNFLPPCSGRGQLPGRLRSKYWVVGGDPVFYDQWLYPSIFWLQAEMWTLRTGRLGDYSIFSPCMYEGFRRLNNFGIRWMVFKCSTLTTHTLIDTKFQLPRLSAIGPLIPNQWRRRPTATGHYTSSARHCHCWASHFYCSYHILSPQISSVFLSAWTEGTLLQTD